MQLEDHVREAIRGEVFRQAEVSGGKLQVTHPEGALLQVQGQIDLDDLVMAITGALAGGP
ncbi:MAG TPA: hypothetical protein VK035_04115 [Kiloniellales bacterium]|nr:hypothetical protein [Kiloniellales bacterium]